MSRGVQNRGRWIAAGSLLILAAGAVLLAPRPGPSVSPRSERVPAEPLTAREQGLPGIHDGLPESGSSLVQREPSGPSFGLSPKASSRVAGEGSILVSDLRGLKNRDGLWTYDSGIYGAEFESGRMEVVFHARVEGLGHPRFGYEFDAVRVGDHVLAEQRRVEPKAAGSQDRHEISFDHGIVEERYILSQDSVEQLFLVKKLPEQAGDIRVSGRFVTNLETPSVEGAVSRVGFTHEGTEAVVLSDAVAVDSRGDKLPLKMAIAKGMLELTVPADWARKAALPITIDPVIGSPLIVDSASDDVGVTAYNSANNEWLVVWHEFVSSKKGFNVLGQRLSATGAFLGSQFTIGNADGDDRFPRISYAPAPINRYLVVWGHAGSPFEVRGRVVNGAGTFFTAEFVVAPPSLGDMDPFVRFDGTNWYVVYESARLVGGSSGTALRGRFVSTSGVPGVQADPEPAPTSSAKRSESPVIAYVNGVYLVLWRNLISSTPPPFPVYHYTLLARTISPSGTPLTPITTIESNDNVLNHWATAGSGTFLLQWNLNTPASTKLAVVGLDLVYQVGPVDTPTILARQEAAYSATDNGWFSATAKDYSPDPGEFELYGSRISASGQILSNHRITYATYIDRNPSLDWNSAANEMLIVYSNFVNGASLQLRAIRWGMGAPVAPPAPTGLAGTAQSTTSIAWSWSNVSGESGYELHDGSHEIKGTSWPDIVTVTEGNLSENTLITRHVHAVNDGISSPASANGAKYTLVRNASTSDFTLTVVSASQIDIIVTPPPNAMELLTGCEIQRKNNNNSYTTIKPFSNAYSHSDTGRSPNTAYTYRIKFKNGDGVANAAYSGILTVTTAAPAAAPAGFSGVAQSSSAITWSWSDILGESGYQVHDAAHATVVATSANVVSVPETGLLENESYTRHVHAVNGVGTSPASGSASRYTKVRDALESDFTLTLATVTQIDVSVVVPPNGAVGSTGCAIQRSQDGSNWTTVKAFSAEYTFQDPGLASDTLYYYRIQYQNVESVPSSFSPSKSMLTGLLPVITTPSKKTRNPNPLIQGTALVGATIRVYFNAVLDGTAVNVNGAWSYAAGNKPEGAYTVTARLFDGVSESGDSLPITVTVDLTAPPPPSSVRTIAYNNTIDVYWDPSAASDVAGYQVLRKTGVTGSWTLLNPSAVVLGTKYRDSTAANGETYFYKVKAVDDAQPD